MDGLNVDKGLDAACEPEITLIHAYILDAVGAVNAVARLQPSGFLLLF